MSGTFNHSPLRQPNSKAHKYQRVGRPCVDTLEDRRLLSFGSATNYSVGANPQSIVAAHFDADGYLDLATADAGTDKVTVRLGDGAGGFGVPRQVSAGAFPRSIAAADFNTDGKIDLVTTSASWHISLQLGNGDGTFQAPAEGFSYGEPLSLAAGDLNGDGHADLAVTGDDWNSFGYVEVHLGSTSGLVRGQTYQIGAPHAGITLADLTADGNPDVLTSEGLLMPGNGDGTLAYEYTGGGGGMLAWAVTVADLTGEGSPDVIFVGESIRVFSDGGSFSHAANGSLHKGVATGDFNSDGKLDVVTADTDAGTVSLLTGNGDGSLRYAGAFATGSAPAAVAVGDFNGDGRPDVAAANGGANTVSILLNNGGGGVVVPPPSLRVGDATVTEGNEGATTAVFTVGLSTPSDQSVTVRYATEDGTAIAGGDYQSASGTLTFSPGQTTQTVAVAVTGDRVPEPGETFRVLLADAGNATIADGVGTGTVLDDEPRLAIDSTGVTEGHSGTRAVTFTVTLSSDYDQAVTVRFATLDGTARAVDDYAARSGTLTFAPGETVKTITVWVKGDKKRESNESFYVDLLGPGDNAIIGVSRGVGTIFNDD